MPLPMSAGLTRPVVPVSLEGGYPVLCLVDSGALRNRFAAEVGEAAGLDLSRGRVDPFQVGSHSLMGHALTVTLAVGKHEWETEVTFAQGWPFSHQILGLYGFFDAHRVRVNAAHLHTQVLPL